jgi:hypothetical protein
MAPFNISFRFKYPNVPPSLGCYHIHAPEHIATTHRIGAPGFVIESVKPPRISATRRSIEFDCRTLNVPMRVFMHRRSLYESELVFTRRRNIDNTLDNLFLAPIVAPSIAPHSAHLFPLIVQSDSKNKAFLRLLFEVFPQVKGHELGVTFSFWNPMIFALVPLFPIFVAINGIEDMLFFQELKEHGYPEDAGTWFDVYRS